MSRCHCHAAPLLSVTLKGRAVVIEWHLVTTPWGATGDSKTMSGTGTLGPRPPTLRAWWVRLFSRSHKCGAGEFLESWYSFPPHGTWLVLYLSAKVSVRRFLSHIFGIVRVSKSMGLEFACSLHMSV